MWSLQCPVLRLSSCHSLSLLGVSRVCSHPRALAGLSHCTEGSSGLAAPSPHGVPGAPLAHTPSPGQQSRGVVARLMQPPCRPWVRTLPGTLGS